MNFDHFIKEIKKNLAVVLDIPYELLEKEYEKNKKRNKKSIVNECLRKEAWRFLRIDTKILP